MFSCFYGFQLPSTSRKSSHRSRSPLEDLIKCFCGACESFFKRKHVIQALKANEYEILSDNDLRAILKKFIESRQGGFPTKPKISEILECFELCDSLLTGHADFDEKRYDLEDFCFTEAWEDKLSKAVDENTTDDFFKDLMIECSRRLGEEPEYRLFKTELQRKLKPWFINSVNSSPELNCFIANDPSPSSVLDHKLNHSLPSKLLTKLVIKDWLNATA